MSLQFGGWPFIAVERRDHDMMLYVVTSSVPPDEQTAEGLAQEKADMEEMVRALEALVGNWRQEHPRGAD